MHVVIDIPDGVYKAIKNSTKPLYYIEHLVQEGTPLPKGHGRLIDADAFITTLEDASKRQNYKELLIDNHFLSVDDVFEAVIASLQNKGLAEGDSPTIIKADKLESEIEYEK